ncbi:unnamed protein product [Nezara viridula]|uniref:Uncharacterized protein n=1 Tax=Nezara viridula TaxID=85310 RepID=A0A9P0GZP4_NEZVI|nr:unnamed protein product [Nezara viridula]
MRLLTKSHKQNGETINKYSQS